jgi:hypothetical protein
METLSSFKKIPPKKANLAEYEILQTVGTGAQIT